MDVVRDEETGLLFKPGDPEKMADKIEYFLDNPDEIQRMGNRGKELIQSTFSVDKMVEGILKIYGSFQ